MRRKKRKVRNVAKATILLCFVIILKATVCILINPIIVETTIRIQDMQEEINRLKTENRELALQNNSLAYKMNH